MDTKLPVSLVVKLDRFKLQSVARGLLPDHRVAKCYRVRISENVNVNYAESIKSAFYTGLMVCGSIWACPVCASKISERRKKELDTVDFSAYTLFMVTVTISHKKDDTLKNLTVGLGQAWRSVRSGRWWSKFKSDYKIVGSFTAQEVTWGPGTGWHPHKHILFLSSSKSINLDEVKRALYSRYQGNLLKRNGHASFEHGITISFADDDVTEYISKFVKWGHVAELTKGTVKRARSVDRYQAFDLLASDSPFVQSKFIEYVSVFSGSRQLVASPGLRELLGLNEVELTDAELAEGDTKEKYILLSSLSASQWKIILKKKIRGQVIYLASMGDAELLNDYLQSEGVQ